MRTELAVEAPCLQMLLAISSMLSASCLKPPASAQAIGEFKSPPQALVAANSATRDFAGTNASLAADLVRLADATTPRSEFRRPSSKSATTASDGESASGPALASAALSSNTTNID
jgi:hypothetical protein